jgi:hypothetical protein
LLGSQAASPCDRGAFRRLRGGEAGVPSAAAVGTAGKGRENRRPAISLGRDGATLREYRFRFFEHATVATLTVYDRAGRRQGTVYLAFAPQLGQQQMASQATALIQEVLRRWESPLPRLAYVTDAGDSETKYFRRVLAKMVHPRTGDGCPRAIPAPARETPGSRRRINGLTLPVHRSRSTRRFHTGTSAAACRGRSCGCW